MVITQSQLSLFLLAIAAVFVLARAGLVADLVLLGIAGYILLSTISAPRLPKRVRWVLPAYILLFLIYLTLTAVQPSFRAMINVTGIGITAVMFIYFAQNAQRLVAARGTASILFGIGLLAFLIGMALFNGVDKNICSGIAAYFFLSAGIIWVMRGVPLRRVTLLNSTLLVGLGLIVGHRIMLGAGVLFMLAILTMYSIPLRVLRTVLLGVMICVIFVMVVLFAGLWGYDIQYYDEIIIEYTGRTGRSGRQLIWPIIIAAAAKSPWLGLGPDAAFSDLYDSEWSAHNQFLQVYLQTGIVGLSALLLLLFCVWAAIGRPQRSQPIRIYMNACFLVLLLHLTLEVFLIQVVLIMGCSAWMMLGIGIGCIRETPTPRIQKPTRLTPTPFSLPRPQAAPLSDP